MKLGIFGGTFNPIHFGHLRVAEEVREKTNLDKIIFIPSGNPPLKTIDLIEASHRYRMTEIAITSNANFEISALEIKQKGKSYTLNTIQRLYKIYPEDELYLILGVDAFMDLPNWWQPEALIRLIDFIVVPRPGFNQRDILKSPYLTQGSISSRPLIMKSGRKLICIQTTQIDISSTKIRKLLRDKKSIKYLLPEGVENYIYSHRLYIEDF